MSPIKSDPEIMGGTPCFTGTRVPIKNLFDYLKANHTLDEFLEDFPSVTRDQALTVLKLAHERLISAAAPRIGLTPSIPPRIPHPTPDPSSPDY